jgi:hypothetical protein
MKLLKIILFLSFGGIIASLLMSADHIDAPSVTGQSTDIADFYAFQSPSNSDNLVFATTLQGLLSPVSTSDATFDENVMLEINIDNNGDAIEDLVIQAIPRDGNMYLFGPYAPNTTGLNSMITTTSAPVIAGITAYGQSARIGQNNGISLFAGPRDDPFFFDLGAYSDILAGNAPGFSNPGTDTFAGTNVLSIVVELPKSMLGATNSINAWVETKIKQ